MPSRGRRVVARKAHRCDTCGTAEKIKPGDVYYASTIFPGDDSSGWDTPVAFKECAFCAERYDRLYILEPLPADQASAVYTNAMRQGRG